MKQFQTGQPDRASKRVIRFTTASLLTLTLSLNLSLPALAQPADPAPEATTGQTTDHTNAPTTRPAGLEDELSNAMRLRAELDALLTADGRLRIEAGESGPARLAGLATRCEVLINSAVNDRTRGVLLGCKARALAALTQFEYAANPAGSGQLRLGQLRAVADQISALDLPSAAPASDYWQLLADLADTERSNASPRSKRALAEELLAGYIEHYADLPVGIEYVADVRLSLARILDERGDQLAAADQLDHIGALSADDPRTAEVERLRSRAERVGTPIAFEGLTTRLNYWQSARYLGKPILVHVYADSVASSVALIEQMSQAIAEGELVDCTVVSLRLGEPVPATPEPEWPVLPVDLNPGGVLDRLGVDALPTLVWIDAQGRLASIGYIPAVLDQMPGNQTQPHPADQAPADERGNELSTNADDPADQPNRPVQD